MHRVLSNLAPHVKARSRIVPFALGAAFASAAFLGFPYLTQTHAMAARLSTIAHLSTATAQYSNTTYGFSLSYPADLSVQAYDEGDHTTTIGFKKIGTDAAFQIFITPDDNPNLTADALTQDIPGLQITGAKPTTVATTTPALAFESSAYSPPGV